MRIVGVPCLAIGCSVLGVAAAAQDHPNLGITIGYPAAVGVIFYPG